MKQIKLFSSLFLPQIASFYGFYFIGVLTTNATTLEIGKELFLKNCAVCHAGGNNIIIPEKNLKKDALEENGMNSLTAINYQILNGKNGMPAFGERLQEEEIEAIAKYVLEESKHNFPK